MLWKITSGRLLGAVWQTLSSSKAALHSKIQSHEFDSAKVLVMPALKDNYMYLLIDKENREAAAIDPVDPKLMIETANNEAVRLSKILTTHHHADHAGGNKMLLRLLNRPVHVYGGDDRIEGLTKRVEHKDKIPVGDLRVEVVYTPCHTAGHVCYYVKTKTDNFIFSGDCIFQGGCGRFFEGTAEQAYCNLCEKISSLPGNTKIFCGHEYTVQNLEFARDLEPKNKMIQERLQWAKEQRQEGLPTVPSTIFQEKQWNPFMRVKETNMRTATGLINPVDVMDRLRLLRNDFKPKPTRVFR